jgi:hypothetical protein
MLAFVPAVLRSRSAHIGGVSRVALGPEGPFPDSALRDPLERRWLHYAFLSPGGTLGMVANIATLGPDPDFVGPSQRSTSILLVHHDSVGWRSSQFNAVTPERPWSAFRQPHPLDAPEKLELESTAGGVGVNLTLRRSSRPCTSQCAPFADGHHLRWQSETGVVASGDWTIGNRVLRGVDAVGYHERVRGRWGWPELGGWVFGFSNDYARTEHGAPRTALVFTLIQPAWPASAATGSIMVWRSGRLARHFPRRDVTVAVRGELDRDRVVQVPTLANTSGTPPMQPVPQRLVVSGRMGADWVVFDFSCRAGARVVIPCETSLAPFSVHEVIGTCTVEGELRGESIAYEGHGIVEFAGGAGGG